MKAPLRCMGKVYGKSVQHHVRHLWTSQLRNPAQLRLVVALLATWIFVQYCTGNWLLTGRAEYATIRDLKEEVQKLKAKVEIHERRFWLDPLEPIFQYRPKFWLGKTDDVDDKDQVTPYFLANFVNASDKNVYDRRIYIDLGLHDFKSSVCWMMQNYPTKFDLVYGFEADGALHADIHTLASNITECVKGTSAEARGYKTHEVLNTFTFYYNFVGAEDNNKSSPPTRGLSQFVRDIGIKENDFVVLKMDVEGWEYDILSRVMDDGTYKFLDEVFVEVHYNHPEMHPWHWYIFKHSRAEIQALLTRARDLGMFIHPWP